MRACFCTDISLCNSCYCGETQSLIHDRPKTDIMSDQIEGGTKHDKDKPDTSLVCYEFVYGIAQVLTFGKAKYGAWNWTKGFGYSRVYAAAIRHLGAWQTGEENDKESGLSHILHAACCLMFLYMHQKFNLGTDDRWKRPNGS